MVQHINIRESIGDTAANIIEAIDRCGGSEVDYYVHRNHVSRITPDHLKGVLGLGDCPVCLAETRGPSLNPDKG
ncbi:MAG TPA: hypothetical protein VMH80_06835 [Bryobacteraceae bacterium]|nr:hypothetical protein [Bryobacteraceae bacterium]